MAMVTVLLGDQTLGNHTISHHPFVVGRDADCDIQIDNIGVSHRHCQFLWEGNAFQVEDLKSTNGTMVNGEKNQKAPVKDGDEIRLGKYKLMFHQAAGEPPPPAKGGEAQSLAGMMQEAAESPEAKAGAPASDGMQTFAMSADLIRQQAGVAASAGGQRAGDLAKSLDDKDKDKKGSKKGLIIGLAVAVALLFIALVAVLIVMLGGKD